MKYLVLSNQKKIHPIPTPRLTTFHIVANISIQLDTYSVIRNRNKWCHELSIRITFTSIPIHVLISINCSFLRDFSFKPNFKLLLVLTLNQILNFLHMETYYHKIHTWSFSAIRTRRRWLFKCLLLSLWTYNLLKLNTTILQSIWITIETWLYYYLLL